MTWQSRTNPIKVGDKVCYSKRFLQSTGQYTGDLPFARGIVTALKSYGEMTIATVDFGGDDSEAKVAIANLSRVTEKGILE